jgi:hypothetical protein
MFSSGNCVCVDGFFDDGSSKNCISCSNKCLTCASNADNCLSCDNGDFRELVSNSCYCKGKLNLFIDI